MKRLWLQLFLLLGIMMLGLSAHVPETLAAPEEAMQAALKGIPLFLENSSPEELALFGFSDSEEVRSATVGEGFRVLAGSPGDIRQGQSTQTLVSITSATNQWQFLVYASGKPACMITVDQVDGTWEPVSIGSRGLSLNLHSITQSWPKSQGYSYNLVRIYQAMADFVELFKESDYQGVIPTESGRAAVGLNDEAFNPNTLLKAAQVVDAIASTVQNSLLKAQ